MKSDEGEEYRERMARRKTRMDDRIAKADEDRGVLVVMTGSGKGKSSSAYGMLARCLGHQMPCALVYFAKSRESGEMLLFQQLPGIQVEQLGEGFSWETQDRDRDDEAAKRAWEVAAGHLKDPKLQLVVLDELCLPLSKQGLELQPILDALVARPASQHVVVTGRNAPKELIEIADTVSDVRLVKHAFRAGIRAQKGIEM